MFPGQHPTTDHDQFFPFSFAIPCLLSYASDTAYSELLIVNQKVGLVAKNVFSSTGEGEGGRLEQKAEIYENFEERLHKSSF
jgi:hypothetical protein